MNHITHEKSMLITTDDWTETAQNQGTPVLEYGIRISSPEEPSFELRRISDDRTFVEKLAVLLLDPDVSPVHYADIIEDAVSEQTMDRAKGFLLHFLPVFVKIKLQ